MKITSPTNTEVACALKQLVSHSVEEWEERWIGVKRAGVKCRLGQYSCPTLSSPAAGVCHALELDTPRLTGSGPQSKW